MALKIRLSNLKKTNIGFPAKWDGYDEDDRVVCLRYRNGFLWITTADETVVREKQWTPGQKEFFQRAEEGRQIFKEYKDEFSLGGVLTDEELTVLLKEHDALAE